MPCYHPLQGYRSQTLTKNGKRKISFSPQSGYIDLPVTVPCGQCIGCRLERSRQWAIRCVHEASQHIHKCFVTLTYDDASLPPGRTLVKAHFQKFIRALRKHSGLKIRYFHCGEYGETDGRPHYHAILYGIDFPDKKFYTRNKQQDTLYTSETLDRIWSKGKCWIGNVTFESAAYVARYVLKKVTGEAAIDHYKYVDPQTGEITDRLPEYITMSLKPGIGGDWYDKYKGDVYPSDFHVLRGKTMRPAKFYDRQLEKADPALLKKLKFKRIKSASKHKADQTPARLAVRKEVKLSQIKSLTRNL